MATYEFSDQIKFLLPSGFVLTKEENDEGEEVVKILAGECENDDGETIYQFSCTVNLSVYDPDTAGDGITSDNLLDKLAERIEDSRRLKLPGKPETVFINKGTPLSLFGRLIKMFACICLVRISDWEILRFISVSRVDDDAPEKNAAVYENMHEVLKAVRINVMKIPVESVSAYMLQDALTLSFDEDGESIDVSPTIQFHFTDGDETTTFEYSQDSM